MAIKVTIDYIEWYKNVKEITYHLKLVKSVSFINWLKDEINCTIILTVAFFTVSGAEKDTNSACYRMPTMYSVYLDLCTLAILAYHTIAVIEHWNFT